MFQFEAMAALRISHAKEAPTLPGVAFGPQGIKGRDRNGSAEEKEEIGIVNS